MAVGSGVLAGADVFAAKVNVADMAVEVLVLAVAIVVGAAVTTSSITAELGSSSNAQLLPPQAIHHHCHSFHS